MGHGEGDEAAPWKALDCRREAPVGVGPLEKGVAACWGEGTLRVKAPRRKKAAGRGVRRGGHREDIGACTLRTHLFHEHV